MNQLQLQLFDDGSAADREIVAGPRKRRRRRAPVRRRCSLCGDWYDDEQAPGQGATLRQCAECTARLARWRADLSGGAGGGAGALRLLGGYARGARAGDGRRGAK